MNYKVLYRKYRPIDFNNIIGQEYIIKTLQNSIINGNIAHAYIFSGPRGTGKTSTAKVFAKAINCLNPNDGSPCNECEFCCNFQDNPDIIEIDAASNNGVDQIRTLIDNIKLTPSNGKYKVYIIDEVHMLTTSAFNALLLTLEEPPKHAIFILATTNIESVPITILSRCQRFDFQKIQLEDIVSRLKEICQLEKIKITDEALTEVAILAEGGMRDALSLLDQMSKLNEKITIDLIENHIKTVSQQNLKELFDSVEQNNIDKTLEIIDNYRKNGVNYKYLIKKIIGVASNNAKNVLIDPSISRLSYTNYKKLILELTDSLNKININVDAFVILEMIILSLFDLKDSKPDIKSPDLEIKEEKESAKDIKKSNKPDNISNDFINIRINNCFVDAKRNYLDEYKENIKKYIESPNILTKSKTALLDSTLVAASKEYLIFSCENDFIADKNNKLINDIEKDYKKYANNIIKIVFISNEDWLKEKQKYVENLKIGYKYKLIAETTQEQNDEVLDDVFDVSKIEIV